MGYFRHLKLQLSYDNNNNNNNALFALITKGHIYIASDKNYSNLRNTYALSRARTVIQFFDHLSKVLPPFLSGGLQ